MKKIVVLIVALFGLIASSPVRGDDSQYIWCTLQDLTHGNAYVSGVFAGDYSIHTRYENAFHDYLNANYNNVIGPARCGFKNDQSEAKAARDGDAVDFKNHTFKVIQTTWTY